MSGTKGLNFTTGIIEVDNDHVNIKALLEKVRIAISRDESSDILLSILDLERFLIFHFDNEMKLMKEHKYPLADQHSEYHLKFMNMLAEMKSNIRDRHKMHVNYKNIYNFFTAHVKLCDAMFCKWISSVEETRS